MRAGTAVIQTALTQGSCSWPLGRIMIVVCFVFNFNFKLLKSSKIGDTAILVGRRRRRTTTTTRRKRRRRTLKNKKSEKNKKKNKKKKKKSKNKNKNFI